MATIKRFEDLEMWKLSRSLCNNIGSLIDNDKLKRNYRLIGQIEGSSGSVMDNIAEGFERGTRAEFIVFLGYAKGSCGELRSQYIDYWIGTILLKRNSMNLLYLPYASVQ